MLLEYFGEIDAPSCGICDVCKSLEKLRLSAFEFETFGKEIRKILSTPMTYENLLMQLKGDREKMHQVIRWLLDNNRIRYRIDNLLEWAE